MRHMDPEKQKSSEKVVQSLKSGISGGACAELKNANSAKLEQGGELSNCIIWPSSDLT